MSTCGEAGAGFSVETFPPDAQDRIESLRPGQKLRIRAQRTCGSARFLDGMFCNFVAKHDTAKYWVHVKVEPNHKTNQSDWSFPITRLEVVDQ